MRKSELWSIELFNLFTERQLRYLTFLHTHTATAGNFKQIKRATNFESEKVWIVLNMNLLWLSVLSWFFNNFENFCHSIIFHTFSNRNGFSKFRHKKKQKFVLLNIVLLPRKRFCNRNGYISTKVRAYKNHSFILHTKKNYLNNYSPERFVFVVIMAG